jgi:hypothetical protein
MLSFSISYPDLIKFPYFVDTTERGLRAESRGDRVKQRVTLQITFTMYLLRRGVCLFCFLTIATTFLVAMENPL